MYGLIAIVLSAVSAVLDVVGLAIPFWCYIHKNGDSIYFGLWQACEPIPINPKNPSSSVVVCEGFDTTPAAIEGARALEILGTLLLIIALTTVVLKQFVMKEKQILLKLGAVCAILGGVLMIAGTIVFATDNDVKLLMDVYDMKLHAGFALCIIAGVIALPAGIVMLLNNTQSH